MTDLQRPDGDGLLGSRCSVCQRVNFPPLLMHCDRKTESTALTGEGLIESFTTIRIAPERFPVPYHLAYIRLAEGPRVLARMEHGAEAPTAGSPVRVHPASPDNQAALIAQPAGARL